MPEIIVVELRQADPNGSQVRIDGQESFSVSFVEMISNGQISGASPRSITQMQAIDQKKCVFFVFLSNQFFCGDHKYSAVI